MAEAPTHNPKPCFVDIIHPFKLLLLPLLLSSTMSLAAASASLSGGVFHDDDWECPTHQAYQFSINELMSFHEGRIDDPFPRNTRYTKEQLLTLTPTVVKRYLAWKAYDDPNPADDAMVVSARAESLRKVKQAISYFVPNRGVAWIDGVGGNPTRHHSIHDLINQVERKETSGNGVEDNSKRGYTEAEMDKKLEILRGQDSFVCKKKYCCMTVWARTLIHRIDDTAKFLTTAPHGDVEFPFVLKTKTNWSKNVSKKIHCPDQIIFGDGNWHYCTQVHLALYLEESGSKCIPILASCSLRMTVTEEPST